MLKNKQSFQVICEEKHSKILFCNFFKKVYIVKLDKKHNLFIIINIQVCYLKTKKTSLLKTGSICLTHRNIKKAMTAQIKIRKTPPPQAGATIMRSLSFSLLSSTSSGPPTAMGFCPDLPLFPPGFR